VGLVASPERPGGGIPTRTNLRDAAVSRQTGRPRSESCSLGLLRTTRQEPSLGWLALGSRSGWAGLGPPVVVDGTIVVAAVPGCRAGQPPGAGGLACQWACAT